MTEQPTLAEIALKNPYFANQEINLDPLPYPVYFVTKDPKWQDLIDRPDLPPVEALYERCVTGHDIWSAQAYVDLKQQGLDVHLVAKPIPGKICVIPYYYLQPKDLLFRSYVVACRYDTPFPAFGNQWIVINQAKIRDQFHHFLPHRPQPSLKPRNPERGTQIANLVFKGHDYNLYAPFRTSEFLQQLHDLNIRLMTDTEKSGSLFESWADYTDVDVVLAVRNNTKYDISLKPALKLINAWFAGCPALLGPEPAYQELRQSELDYIEVRTPEETVAALKYLQNHPEIYQAMIENGFRRAQEFTVGAILSQWRNLLAGPIAQGYEQWLRQSPIEKYAIRPIQYSTQVIQHRQAKKHYDQNIRQGTRILSDS